MDLEILEVKLNLDCKMKFITPDVRQTYGQTQTNYLQIYLSKK